MMPRLADGIWFHIVEISFPESLRFRWNERLAVWVLSSRCADLIARPMTILDRRKLSLSQICYSATDEEYATTGF